jgi:hypothetical protein
MFGIKINGEFLDLPDGFKIRVRLENTLFQTEYKNNAYTFPATVVDSDRNRKLLNYASDVQVKSDEANGIPCVLVSGTLEWDCLLWVERSIFSKDLNISLKVAANNTVKKLLTDLEYGGVRNLDDEGESLPENLEDTNNYTHSKDRDYYWGMYYNGCTDPSMYIGIINDFDDAGTFDAVSLAIGIGDTSKFTPMPYLNYVLKQIAIDMGVNVEGNWWDDEELDSLVVFNNRTLELNHIGPTWQGAELNLKWHLPIMTIEDFIGALKNTFCLMVETFNGKFTISSFKDILKDFIVKDWTAKSHRVYERSRIPVGYEIGSTFDPADVMYENFVKPLRLLKYLGEFGATPVGASEGEWYLDTVSKNYYIFNASSAWELLSFEYAGVKAGDESIKYITRMCTPIFRTDEAPPLGGRMPWVEMNSEGQYTQRIEEKTEDFGPRLVFARGWYDNQIDHIAAAGIKIPVISGEPTDKNGTVWGNYGLRYKDAGGLFVTWWETFLKMVAANDTVFFDLEMNDADLGKWTFGEFIRIGGEVFYPKFLDVELGHKGVEAARVETLKLQ